MDGFERDADEPPEHGGSPEGEDRVGFPPCEEPPGGALREKHRAVGPISKARESARWIPSRSFPREGSSAGLRHDSPKVPEREIHEAIPEGRPRWRFSRRRSSGGVLLWSWSKGAPRGTGPKAPRGDHRRERSRRKAPIGELHWSKPEGRLRREDCEPSRGDLREGIPGGRPCWKAPRGAARRKAPVGGFRSLLRGGLRKEDSRRKAPVGDIHEEQPRREAPAGGSRALRKEFPEEAPVGGPRAVPEKSPVGDSEISKGAPQGDIPEEDSRWKLRAAQPRREALRRESESTR